MRQERWIEWLFVAVACVQCICMSILPNTLVLTVLANLDLALAVVHHWRYELAPLYVLLAFNTTVWAISIPVSTAFAVFQGLLCILTIGLIVLFPLPLFPPLSEDHPQVGCIPMQLNGVDCRVYYPADESATTRPRMPYLHHGKHLGIGLNVFVPHIPAWAFSSLQNGRLDARAHATVKPPPTESGWPVVVFSHGLGGALELYSSICQHLASEGLIVVSVNHTDGSASVYKDPKTQEFRYYQAPPPTAIKNWTTEGYPLRNKQLHARVKQVRGVLDALVSMTTDRSSIFYKHLDLSNVAAAGHSFGGATAFTTAKHDSRVKAVVALDMWMEPLDKQLVKEGIAETPVLSVISQHWLEWTTHHETMQKTLFKCLHPQTAFVAIESSRHNNFCDLALFSPLLNRLAKATGTIHPTRLLHMTSQLTAKYLRQQFHGGKTFNTIHRQYPEIVVLAAKPVTTSEDE